MFCATILYLSSPKWGVLLSRPLIHHDAVSILVQMMDKHLLVETDLKKNKFLRTLLDSEGGTEVLHELCDDLVAHHGLRCVLDPVARLFSSVCYSARPTLLSNAPRCMELTGSYHVLQVGGDVGGESGWVG